MLLALVKKIQKRQEIHRSIQISDCGRDNKKRGVINRWGDGDYRDIDLQKTCVPRRSVPRKVLPACV